MALCCSRFFWLSNGVRRCCVVHDEDPVCTNAGTSQSFFWGSCLCFNCEACVCCFLFIVMTEGVESLLYHGRLPISFPGAHHDASPPHSGCTRPVTLLCSGHRRRWHLRETHRTPVLSHLRPTSSSFCEEGVRFPFSSYAEHRPCSWAWVVSIVAIVQKSRRTGHAGRRSTPRRITAECPTRLLDQNRGRHFLVECASERLNSQGIVVGSLLHSW